MKNRMNRALALILAVLLVCSLTACASGKSGNGGESKATETSAAAADAGSAAAESKAAETTAAAAETKAAEAETAAAEAETKAADAETAAAESAPAEESTEAAETYALETDVETEDIPLLTQAVAAIDDSLEEVWGENRELSYTLETNTIYITIWDEGLNSETVEFIENWEALKEDKIQLFNAYYTVFDQLGMEDGHMFLQYVSDTEDYSFLTIEDGEVTYDVFADDGTAEYESGEVGGTLLLSEDEQIAVISEYLECKPENIVFEDFGTFNDDEAIAVFKYVDDEGTASDILLLLFDDGTLVGYTPDQYIVEPEAVLSNDGPEDHRKPLNLGLIRGKC